MTLQLASFAADLVPTLARRALPQFLPADRPRGGGFTLLPELFAFPEIGWLAQEGRAVLARLSGRPKPGGATTPENALIDIDVHEEAFRRLVAHPRLLAVVRGRIGAAPRVRSTRLVAGSGARDSHRPSRGLVAAVALTAGALRSGAEGLELDPGAVALIEARSPLAIEGGDWFLITYDALGERPVAAVYGDDCLWPSPIACAG